MRSVYPQKMGAIRWVMSFSQNCGLFKLVVKLSNFELAGTNILCLLFSSMAFFI